MTFLNPLFFIATIAGILPLLIHLLSRRKLKTIYFSGTIFLRDLQKDKMRKIKLKQILLLILRTLIILVIVTAFARPALRGTFGSRAESHAPTSVVILLDTSYSMAYRTGDGTLFEKARAVALKIAELLRKGDEAYFVPFSDRPYHAQEISSHDFPTLKKAIGRTEVRQKGTDFKAAINQAITLLKDSKNANREIYLVTDMARNGWPPMNTKFPDSQDKRLVFYILHSPETKRSNQSVDTVVVATQILAQNKPIAVETKISNYSQADIENIPVKLYVEGAQAGQSVANLTPEQSRKLSFQFTPQKPGLVSGYIEVEDDKLLQDNRGYFSLKIPGQIKILLVGGKESDLRFLIYAFGIAEPDNRVFQLSERTVEKLMVSDIVNSDVVILSNVPRFSEAQITALEANSKKGKGTIIVLGDNVETNFYNDRLLSALLPVKLKAISGNPNQRGSFRSFGKIDYSHPIFNGLVKNNRIQSPKFYASWDVSISPEAETIVQYSGGGAALVEGRKAKVLLLTTSLDLKWTNLPIKGIFLPMFYRAVQYLTTDLSEIRSYTIDQPIERKPPGVERQKPMECENPLGESSAILPVNTPQGYRFRLENVPYTGIWHIFSNGSEVDRFAVNVDSRESDITPLEKGRLKNLFKGANLRLISQDADLSKEVFRSRYGHELWKYCLTVALILMLVEMILAISTLQKPEVEKGSKE